MNEQKILIIDDDAGVCRAIASVARKIGLESSLAHTLQDGMSALSSDRYTAVFLDLRMPDGNGMDLLPRICTDTDPPEVIVITGHGDEDSVVKSLSLGAWDYIEKPFSRTDLTQLLKDILISRKGAEGREVPIDFRREGILGKSQAVQKSFDLIRKAAASNASVLLTGETGTGKEIFARTIHEHSLFAQGEFVIVDCAAIPPTLVESILFGHEKGAFTGADRSQQGLVSQAHHGTLFLDEVGELPLSVQKKFLRVLQEGRFRPVGKATEVESTFRVISATNKNLGEQVRNKRFREDLLFRLGALTIDVPPLRERIDDIPTLTDYYLGKLCTRNKMKKKRLSSAFMTILRQYPWPGNIRELIHALESALAVAHDSPILVPKHLPYHIHVQVKRSALIKVNPQGTAAPRGNTLPSLKEVREDAINEIEQQYLQELMRQSKGNVKRACSISGLSRSRLYALLKLHNIQT
ncbi:MAG: sigma-54-dependent transcriptional regulator [Desulfomonilia bacterium]